MSIGHRCKRSNAFSRVILINRAAYAQACHFNSDENKVPGGNTGGATPLPIPNRVVKPSRANGTVLVTVRESRSSPGFLFCMN